MTSAARSEAVLQHQQPARPGQRAQMMIRVCNNQLPEVATPEPEQQSDSEHDAADRRRRRGAEVEGRRRAATAPTLARDDAEAGQDGEAEIAGVVRGERLQALGVRRREAALFDELLECAPSVGQAD